MDNQLPKLPRGLGSYDKLSSGLIRYRKNVNVYGETVRLSVTGNTISEVNKLMREAEDNAKLRYKNNFNKEQKKTLADGMYDWLMLYKINDVSARTFDRIESIYNCYIKNSKLGRTLLSKIDGDDIQLFMANLKKVSSDEEPSFSTKKKIYELLGQYFKYYYIKEPNKNPMLLVTLPKKDITKIDEGMIVYNDEEIQKFMKEAATPLFNGLGGHRYGLLFNFMLWTVLRIGEATALTWRDIDLTNNTVNVNKALSSAINRDTNQIERKITKTKNRTNRVVPMVQEAVDAITEYKKRANPQSEDEYVFANPDDPYKALTNNSLTRAYNNIVKNAGLDYKHVTIHGLRHTGISAMLRGGVPIEVVSRIAGHQSIQITTDIYYSVLEEQKINAIKNFTFNKERH